MIETNRVGYANPIPEVRQRDSNDCLTACIATLTGIPYEECPFLWDYVGDEWVKALKRWAESKSIGIIYWNVEEGWPVLDGIKLIACGSTNRSNMYDHAVIAKARWTGERTELEFEFDPAGQDFIQDVKYIVILWPIQEYARRAKIDEALQ